MERKRSSRFRIVHAGNVARLVPLNAKATESVYKAARSVATALQPIATPISNIDPRFSSKQLDQALGDSYQMAQTLRLSLATQVSDIDETGSTDIQCILALAEQQLAFGRRDHARSERMLDCYRPIRRRLEDFCGLSEQRGCDLKVQIAANIDRQLAELLANLMDLAAAYNPDDSEYSMEWRAVLAAHADDLRLVVSAVLKGHPLQPPYYLRDPRATGQFVLSKKKTQAAMLEELADGYGYTVVTEKAATAVCYSPITMQIVLVRPEGARQDIDVLHLIRYASELPDPRRPALVGTSDPSMVVYIKPAGGICRLLYNWLVLRYVYAP